MLGDDTVVFTIVTIMEREHTPADWINIIGFGSVRLFSDRFLFGAPLSLLSPLWHHRSCNLLVVDYN